MSERAANAARGDTSTSAAAIAAMVARIGTRRPPLFRVRGGGELHRLLRVVVDADAGFAARLDAGRRRHRPRTFASRVEHELGHRGLVASLRLGVLAGAADEEHGLIGN